MKILLTGATGFIGSAFLKLAAGRGHEVASLVRPDKELPMWWNGLPGVRAMRGTLAEAPWSEVAEFRPEVCVHAAWIATPGVYLESPENHQYLASSLAFLRRARDSGARRSVVLGTCIEYQTGSSPFSEDRTPLAPVTIYARCKNALRIAWQEDCQAHGGALAWARIFYPYGPGEHSARLCSTAIRNLRSGHKVFVKSRACPKDYIYIDDLAAALLTVVEREITGPVNLGTGLGATVGEVARTIGELLGRPDLVEFADPPVPDPLGEVIADASRLRSLGWQPRVSLREGLTRLMACLPV